MATPVLGVQCVAANKFLHFYGGAILMEGAAAMHQKNSLGSSPLADEGPARVVKCRPCVVVCDFIIDRLLLSMTTMLLILIIHHTMWWWWWWCGGRGIV
jgi:hypothetical protein